MTGAVGRSPQPRGPALLYCTLTVVLVLLVAALALSAQPPPPPQIAELTPQAQHQITRAPNQLSSNLGSALGGLGGPGGPAVTTTTRPGQEAPGAAGTVPPPIVEAAVHHCFGNPPRQISFDTQSPPCVAYWAGDNGGATARGVSGTTIRIALLSNGADTRAVQDLQTWINRTFELYGRTVYLDNLGQGPSSNYQGDECTYQKTVADSLAAQDYFATTDPDGEEPACFLYEAAEDRLLTVAGFPWFSSHDLARRAPYLYQYQMGVDQELTTAGRMICADLAGQKASFSPNPVLSSEERKFGAIIQYNDGPSTPSVGALSSQMARCGARLAATDMIEWNESTNDQTFAQDVKEVATEDQQAVLDMQGAGVTTVFCLCQVFAEDFLPGAADSQHYYPEWLLVGPYQDFDISIKAFWGDASQERSLMGMAFEPRQVPYPDTTLNQAIAEVDPGYAVDSNEATWIHTQDVYWMLLLLASGIQMAGPDLTPYTFEHALQATHFPNPYGPEMEGAVGFPGASFSMTTDAAIMWWSPSTPSPYPDEGTGTWCYVDGGRRYSLSNWPGGSQGLFQAPCDA